jgi:hypothetical protein
MLFGPAEERGYVMTCPALPGLVTEGDTLEESVGKSAVRHEMFIAQRLSSIFNLMN